MFLSRIQVFIGTFIGYLLFPILLLIGFFIFRSSSNINNLIYIFFVGNIIFLLIKTAAWEFINYYLKYVLVFIYLLIAFINIVLAFTGVSSVFEFKVYIKLLILILSFALTYLNLGVVLSSIKPKNAIKLSFPFKNGKYIITDGGDGKKSSLMNYHIKAQVHKKSKVNTSMRYAVDIAKLNKFGLTVKSVLTKDNEDYEIFNEVVYSPCDATVVNIVDGIEDNIPFSKRYPYNVGNCIVLKVEEYYIIMGHLRKGSISVKIGDKVKSGQKVGIIGNCGLSPRPHIHMQVSKCKNEDYWQGEGVPIIFNNEFYPTKNRTIKV